MQLKKTKQRPRNIHRQLAAATCGLLAGASHAGGLVASGNNWKIDSALMVYSEKDRVSLAEPVLSLSKEIDDDEFINVRIVSDVLTGASPNGAAPGFGCAATRPARSNGASARRGRNRRVDRAAQRLE